MAEGFPFEIDLPAKPLPAVEADPFLLRRAVNNLLTNCVRHNAPGCSIRLGARARQGGLVLWVEGGATADAPAPAGPDHPLEPDGGASHGTGAAAGGPDRRGPRRAGQFLCRAAFPLRAVAAAGADKKWAINAETDRAGS